MGAGKGPDLFEWRSGLRRPNNQRVPDLHPDDLAREAIEKRLGPVVACAWVRAYTDDGGPTLGGWAYRASFGGPLRRSPVVLAQSETEVLAVDVRWPGPRLAVLHRWPVSEVMAVRVSDSTALIEFQGVGQSKFRVEHEGAAGRHLLDVLTAGP